MSGAANALPRLNASLFGLSGGELLLLLIALLFAARSRLRPGAGFEKFKGLVAEALDIFNCTAEIQDPNLDHEDLEPPMKFNLALWIAQGFGVGRIPVAPGTFGEHIAVALRDGTMPPYGAAPRPSAAERELVIGWIVAGMPDGDCGVLFSAP